MHNMSKLHGPSRGFSATAELLVSDARNLRLEKPKARVRFVKRDSDPFSTT